MRFILLVSAVVATASVPLGVSTQASLNTEATAQPFRTRPDGTRRPNEVGSIFGLARSSWFCRGSPHALLWSISGMEPAKGDRARHRAQPVHVRAPEGHDQV